ncbi:MAG: P-type DNA transfer ATPase VirB11 [Legionellales bacterium]|nr:P-type DNA transfer ATPase VirB11 [Legionellales bacterium]
MTATQVTPFKDHALRQLLRPLAPYLDDKRVTEIRINRPMEVVVETPQGKTFHSCETLDYRYLKGLMTAIQTYNGLANQAQHYAILPDGERVTMLQPPAVLEGILSIIIRKHSLVTKSLSQLVDEGAFKHCQVLGITENKNANHNDEPMKPLDQHLIDFLLKKNWVSFLTDAVVYKRNIVIAGKTGSGKTTLARSLIESIPHHERLITIEDVHELTLPHHPDKIHLLYGSNHGRLSATECLSSCMRLSPDRILLAELRGNEAWDYISSLNTGHPGSITTTHANSAKQAFDRIATLIKQSPSGVNLDLHTIQDVLLKTLDIVIYLDHFQIKEIWFDPILTQANSIRDAAQ